MADVVAHKVVFQPIVRLADWQVLGYEALARFEDGRLPTAHLLDARRADTLVELELALIETALASARPLPSDVMVTLNACAETLVHPQLAEMLGAEQSREWGVELSEMSAVSLYDELQQTIRGLGVVLLIDDAGSRFSDLDRVQRSAPSIVKVDKGLLHAATDAAPDSRGLRQYGAAAHAAGALALAEGVESPAHARILVEHGYDLGQGYLFGHPAPAEDWVARSA